MKSLTPPPKMQFFDSNGEYLSGGKIYTYESGTITPLATYTDYGGLTPNTNPVILDSRGQASVWLGQDPYTFAVYDSLDVLQPDGGDHIIAHDIAKNVSYDDSLVSVTADNVQDAIDLLSVDIFSPVEDIISLINVSSPADNQTHLVLSFFDGLNKGGGDFYWDLTVNNNIANGITIIDPDNIGGFDGTISTRDAFLAAQGSGVGFGCWIRVNFDNVINVEWSGAIGNGVDDDAVAIQAVIDAAQLASFPILMPQGVHVVSTTLSVDASKPFSLSNLSEENAIIESTGKIIDFSNTEIGDTSLSSDIAFDDSIFSLSDATGIVPGQLLVIRSTEQFEETSRSGTKDASFIVDSVSGNDVSVETPSHITFTVSGETITVKTYDVPGIKIEGISFSSTMATGEAVIIGNYVGNVEINKCKVFDPDETDRTLVDSISGIQLNRSANINISNSSIEYFGYAIYLIGTTRSFIDKVHAYKCRHLQNHALGTTFAYVTDCTANECYSGFDSHQESLKSVFTRCLSVEDVIPCKFRGRNDSIIDCELSMASFETDPGLLVDAAFAEGEDQSYFLVKNIIGCFIHPDTTDTALMVGAFVNVSSSVFIGGKYNSETRHVSIYNSLFEKTDTKSGQLPFATVHGVYRDVTVNGIGDGDRGISVLADASGSKLLIDGCLFDGHDIGIRFSSGGDQPDWTITNTKISNCPVAGMHFSAAAQLGDVSIIVFSGNLTDISGTLTKSASIYTLT